MVERGKKDMKSLNEVEKIVGLKRRAIQEYEDAGLADKPTQKNKYGYLLYDSPEIERLWQLKFYKELGYNITKIKEIQAKGRKYEKEELGDVIEALKEKRDKLNNLISIAEMMNETGWSFNDFKNGIVTTDDIHADNFFDILGAISNITRYEDMDDCIVEDILTDDEFEMISSYLKKIEDCLENNFEYTDEIVQAEIRSLHKVFSKALSGSVFFLRMVIIGMDADEEIKKDLGENVMDYLMGAIRHYCDENKDNPTDMALIDAFKNIEKLGRSRHTTSCDEVQNEVNNIYMYFDKIEMFKPEIRKMYLKNVGKLFGTQAYKNVIDGGAQKGISWFISRAIEIYFDNMEKEKMNG